MRRKATHSGTDDILLDDYLTQDAPGIGAYDVFIQDYAGGFNFRLGAAPPSRRETADRHERRASSLRTAAQGGGWLDTNVAEYYSLGAAYRFATFYHPLVGDLIKKVNGEGATAALTRAMQRTSDTFFIAAYQPTDEVVDDYPVRNFSFSDLDANGFYNYEFFFHLPLLIATRLSKNQQFADAQRWFDTIFDPHRTHRPQGRAAVLAVQAVLRHVREHGRPPVRVDLRPARGTGRRRLGRAPPQRTQPPWHLKRQTEAQIATCARRSFRPARRSPRCARWPT